MFCEHSQIQIDKNTFHLHWIISSPTRPYWLQQRPLCPQFCVHQGPQILQESARFVQAASRYAPHWIEQSPQWRAGTSGQALKQLCLPTFVKLFQNLRSIKGWKLANCLHFLPMFFFLGIFLLFFGIVFILNFLLFNLLWKVAIWSCVMMNSGRSWRVSHKSKFIRQ